MARSGVPFHTSDTVMRIDDLPARMVILGGGYIAAEFAHVFSALGVHVTLVVRGTRLLRHLDSEVSDRFTELACGRVGRAPGHRGGRPRPATTSRVRLDLSDGSTVQTDLLLVATGRVPNTG